MLQVPSLEEITNGLARIDALRPIAIEELLGRDTVAPNPQLLGPGITNQVVLVSGAGGSIGSELCRQILRLKPKCLILLERSEPALYAIERDLRRALSTDVDLVAVLGSVTNQQLVERVLRNHSVHAVFMLRRTNTYP